MGGTVRLLNPFERFGLAHLSPSSLNMYAEDAAFWSLKYLHKIADPAGPAAWRGSAIEAGLDHWLFKRDEAAAVHTALSRFELEAMGQLDDGVDRERVCVCSMLDRAITALANQEQPTARQFKVEFWFDGIEVPVIGFADYEWPEWGLDLKTTRRMPSVIPPRHAKQIALYSAARKKPYKLLYATEKKAEIKELLPVEAETWLKRLEWHAHAVRRVLAMFPDAEAVSRIFVPNFEHIYWRDNDAAKAKALEIWS